MPTFDDETTTAAPPEDVWKLLHDPTRLPLWWVGVGSVAEVAQSPGEPSEDPGTGYTMYPTGYPDFPMPQQMRTRAAEHRVVVSCQVSDLVYEWSLIEEQSARDQADHADHAASGGDGTRIHVHVDIPESEAARLPVQREAIRASLRRLGDLAASS